ncbi:hypothetical protein FRC02_000309 [Tulasnella sp. 418]|nr:hypothetical protein FRC02_000309 [Tulasnella sp. 418]
MGRQSHLIPTAEWLRSLPHNHKIVIAGNHDLTLDNCEPGKWYDNNGLYFHRGIPEDTEACRRLFTGEEAVASNLHYLEYDSITIQPKEGGRVWKIYGSPGTPWFGGWAFNYGRGGEDAEVLSGMPDDCDIVVTHGPPCGILDLTISGVLAGCQVLRDRLSQIRPALSVFGHIHESRGVELRQWKSDEDSHTPKRSATLFVNAANMPMGAKARELRARGINTTVGGPGFQPIVVDLEDTA